MDYITWKDFHPELADIFDSTWDYKKIPWPCEVNDTGLGPVYQPCIAVGPAQELFVVGKEGQVFHSRDLGRTWALLCQSPSFKPEVPGGLQICALLSSGIAVSTGGTLLLAWGLSYNDGRSGWSHKDETLHRVMWMTRSEDHGKTWGATELLDPSPIENIADQATIIQLGNGQLMAPFCVEACSRPGKPVNISKAIYRSFIYTSIDDGRAWSKLSEFPDHSSESHLLELPSGTIVASLRYQRAKLPEDRPTLGGWAYDLPSQRDNSIVGGPTAIGRTVFQGTAFTSSEDGGKTWATPRLVTGALAQTGCLVRLSEGTLILTFGRHGQRFMLSYDDGKTWSKAVYTLNNTGEYARSVALEDDTITTIHDSVGKEVGRGSLSVLRWRAPSREEVEQHGFFTPREVETGLT